MQSLSPGQNVLNFTDDIFKYILKDSFSYFPSDSIQFFMGFQWTIIGSHGSVGDGRYAVI